MHEEILKKGLKIKWIFDLDQHPRGESEEHLASVKRFYAMAPDEA